MHPQVLEPGANSAERPQGSGNVDPLPGDSDPCPSPLVASGSLSTTRGLWTGGALQISCPVSRTEPRRVRPVLPCGVLGVSGCCGGPGSRTSWQGSAALNVLPRGGCRSCVARACVDKFQEAVEGNNSEWVGRGPTAVTSAGLATPGRPTPEHVRASCHSLRWLDTAQWALLSRVAAGSLGFGRCSCSPSPERTWGQAERGTHGGGGGRGIFSGNCKAGLDWMLLKGEASPLPAVRPKGTLTPTGYQQMPGGCKGPRVPPASRCQRPWGEVTRLLPSLAQGAGDPFLPILPAP